VIENDSLERLVLDRNPIGDMGAKSVMMIPMYVGNRVDVSSNKCNIEVKDAKPSFDFSKPCKAYNLDLSKPYDRAVAFALMRLVACHQSVSLYKATFNNRPMKFAQEMAPVHPRHHNEAQRRCIEEFQRIGGIVNDSLFVEKVFDDIDFARRGKINRLQLTNALLRLGWEFTQQYVDELLSQFDTELQGYISRSDYLMVVKDEAETTALRLRDMMQLPVMVDAETGQRFVVPVSQCYFALPYIMILMTRQALQSRNGCLCSILPLD
jgi:hypothetical protein